MHGSALVFMVLFWALVLGLVVFVFCRLYCTDDKALNIATDKGKKENFEEDYEEVT